jgi:hypothetical protein
VSIMASARTFRIVSVTACATIIATIGIASIA